MKQCVYVALSEWFWKGKTERLRGKPVSVVSSTTNTTWTDLGLKPGLRCDGPAIKYLVFKNHASKVGSCVVVMKTENFVISWSDCWFLGSNSCIGRSQWPRGLSCGSAVTRFLGLWVRIPLGALISSECYILSSRGHCVGLITHPEESYWVWWWNLDNEEVVAHWGAVALGGGNSCFDSPTVVQFTLRRPKVF